MMLPEAARPPRQSFLEGPSTVFWVPVVEEIAAERPDIKVGKINVDEQPELAGQYRVMSIPTLLVMKGGKVVNQMVGARPKAQVLAMLEKA